MKTLIDISDDKRRKMKQAKKSSGVSFRYQVDKALDLYLQNPARENDKSNKQTK
jgi:hypothetical protein